MKLKKIISALIALSMVSAFAVTASAELAADNSSGSVVISTIPTKEEFAARATTVDTTVTQLTEAEAGMPSFDDFYDENDDSIDFFTESYKIYKISNKVKVGDVASQNGKRYCGVYGITVSYDITAEQAGHVAVDAYDTKVILATVDGANMTALAGIKGTQLNTVATSTGTKYDSLYPGAGNYIKDAIVTLNTYVVLNADAPAISLPKNEENSEIIYYANYASTAVENAKNTPTMNNASITLGEAAKTEYTVTFMNGEDTVQSGKVEEGAVITAPADPEKAGYTFDGWYDGETKFVAGTTASKNVTYTAKFTKIPDPEQTITVGTPFKGTENKGYVWRVTVENFKNAGLSYKFTDEDTSEVREDDFNLGSLELSNFVFDVIMNTERANVKLEVK